MRRERGYTGIITVSILLLLIFGAFYLFNSKYFERNAPLILCENEIYWNLKKPLKIHLKDDSSIKFALATLSDGKNSVQAYSKSFSQPKKDQTILIKPPRGSFTFKKKEFILNVEAIDTSKWSFFSGNKAKKSIHVVIDYKKPKLFIVNNSYGIRKGGSALVVFMAKDKNLKELYIKTPFGKKFIPTPFYKKNYYLSLLAWPIKAKNFRADIVAVDKAGNISKAHIPLYFKKKRYRKSTIKLSDNFFNNKVTAFIEKVAPKQSSKNPVEQFIYINEKIRKQNEDTIAKFTSATDTNLIKNFKLKHFYPLRNAKTLARFGDFRTYLYKGKKITTSYHLGIDLASTARAKIKASNPGKTVFADFNGIYGNNLIVSHGIGLYSLYAHCSEFFIRRDDTVKRGEIIAKTGKTGMVMGDHLHFGIYVQGVAVYPIEWMDRHWIKVNILNILKDSKKIIDKSDK